MTLNKLHLIYHPKDKETFKEAKWGKDYTPDLSIVTRARRWQHSVQSLHHWKLPRSQHRPVLLHYGIRIPLTESIEKSRWNRTAAKRHNRATANRQMEELNDQRKRKWEKRTEKRGFCFGNLVPIRTQVLLPLHIK
jgi:uncharacterized protein (DUF2235 family)